MLVSAVTLIAAGCGGGDGARPAGAPIESLPEIAPAPLVEDGSGEEEPVVAPTSDDTPTIDELLEETEHFEEEAAAEAEANAPPMRSPEPVEEGPEGEGEPGLEEGVVLIRPGEFRQPAPTVTADEVPGRPANFADFGRAALPWIQTRITVELIVPLFEVWGMPAVAGGTRLNLVDSNGQGLRPGVVRFSVVVVYTDPTTAGEFAVRSNLVVYDPVPGTADQFAIAYDHDMVQAREGLGDGAEGIIVLGVTDVTGDGVRDILFEELICVALDECRLVTYALSYEDGGYRRATLEELVWGS